MSLAFLPFIKPQFEDNNGAPLAGGKLYSYIAGTTTPLATYQDSAGSVANTNPLILDAGGRANVFITVGGGGVAYKFVLKDADDNLIFSVDDVTASSEAEVSGWSEHAITDGQSASDLAGELLDMSTYSSALYDVEISRGTTVLSTGQFAIQNLNGSARVRMGTFMGEAHGITISLSGILSATQLRAAASAGPGDGAIKLSRRLIAA